MTQEEKQKLTGALALEAIDSGLPKLFDRIKKALKSKGLTLDKALRIFATVQAAVKSIESILAEK